jgi:monoterpene epsilon-lactone hydrolase
MPSFLDAIVSPARAWFARASPAALLPRSAASAMAAVLALVAVLWAWHSRGAAAWPHAGGAAPPQQCTPPLAPASPPRPFCFVPPYLSPGAREFLAAAAPGPVDVSSPAAAAAARAGFARAKAALSEGVNAAFFSSLANETLGGVPTLLAAPKAPPGGAGAGAGAADGKVLLYLPGGAYVLGACPLQLSVPANAARAAHVRVRCVQYRLAPEHPFPAGLDDAVAAYRAALKTAAAKDIALLGDSAGGGLALALLQRLHAEGLPQPAAAVLYSPWVELTKAGDTHTTLAGVDPKLLHDFNLKAPALAYAGGDAAKLADPLVSPLRADWSKAAVGQLPPILIQVGLRDTFLSDVTRLYRKLQAAGQPVVFSPWDGMWHVFQGSASLPEAAAAGEEAGAFLRRHLGI